MQLTPKQRFLRTVKGEEVDHRPMQCDFSASGLKNYLHTKGINNVSDLELLPFFENHVLYAYMNGTLLDMKTKRDTGSRYALDEWQCEWDLHQDLMYSGHPLPGGSAYKSYVFPDPNAVGYLDYAENLVSSYADKYIVTSYHFACLFERAYILRGFENALVDFLLNKEFIAELLNRITQFHVDLAKRYVSIGVNCGRIVDDYGSQLGLMMSPAVWRQFIKPNLARITAVYKNAGLPVILHSCGDVSAIIEDFIEIGIDVLNPVQPNVMDLESLVDTYGQRIAFFGGICNQEILPLSTPEQIDAEVARVTKLLGRHGRYIISPSNGIGTDVPQQNIEAYMRAAAKYSKML
ncbi:MAG: hypothetical protein HN389_02275 [Clostridia bacterium]|jgi:uroporphyrinogen decarboxylase|nr:hypothetical protein [Clostridia bacterium]